MIKRYRSNEKGMSVVEILAAIAISSMIITAITTFMIVNINSFNSTKNSVDLQYEAQLIMNTLVDTLMEASAIKNVEDKLIDGNNLMGDVSAGLGRVVFTIPRKGAVAIEEEVTLYREDGTNNLYLKNTEIDPDKSELLTSYLDVINIEAADGRTLEKCKAIRINLSLTYEGQSIALTNEVKFRNSK